MSSSNLRLAWCNHKAALWACKRWHYSRTIPQAKRVNLGVWENEHFIGAIIFSTGSGGAANGKRFGLEEYFEMAELQRVALTDHETPVSRIMSIAVKMLRAQSPGLKLLVSYADPSKGHHGGIYQASGWVYVGLSSKSWEYHHPDGRIFVDRVIDKTGWGIQYGRYKKNPVPLNELQKVRTNGKHKYLLPLDPDVRLRIEALAKPYPKRPKDSSEPPVHHTGEGGAAPTRTLHTSP